MSPSLSKAPWHEHASVLFVMETAGREDEHAHELGESTQNKIKSHSPPTTDTCLFFECFNAFPASQIQSDGSLSPSPRPLDVAAEILLLLLLFLAKNNILPQKGFGYHGEMVAHCKPVGSSN